MINFKTPRSLLEAYSSGLLGAYCDKEETDKLMGDLKHPLFGLAAHNLYGTGEGKVSLPFKCLLKFDPGFGPAEAQTTGDCFCEDAIVIGSCNKITDVNIGDKIYAADGRYTTVISKQEKISNNPLIKIKTKGSIPLSVTSDHKVMVGRKEELSDGNLITKVVTKNWVLAQDIKKGDYLITPVNLQKVDRPINKFTISEDFDWFLGYFLGDGWCDAKTLEITFAEHQIDLFKRCESFLINLGFNVRRCNYKSKKTTAFRLRCWCPEFATFLRNISYNSKKDKVFPNWQIGNRHTVQGLVDSDGFKKENKEVFDSKSISLVYGVYYSYLEMGYKPTINYFHRSKKGAYKDTQSYRVTCIYNKKKNYSFIKDQELYIQVSGVEIKEGPHKVYDIGVDDKKHAFLVNGCVAHNCVSHATRNAVDISRSVEIINGEKEAFLLRGATEGIYGHRGHRGQGMTCAGAARFVSERGGILLRKDYGFVDLSVYNAEIGTNWGGRGVPSQVKKEGSKHQVKTISMVHSTEDARDAIANGYALSVCSNQGFSSRRDKNGICSPKGNWGHAMAWIGCDDSREVYDETLFLIQNSWGKWNNGPKRHDQPDGSFWIREKVAKKMIAANGSFVFSNIDGFEARKITWTIDEVF